MVTVTVWINPIKVVFNQPVLKQKSERLCQLLRVKTEITVPGLAAGSCVLAALPDGGRGMGLNLGCAV